MKPRTLRSLSMTAAPTRHATLSIALSAVFLPAIGIFSLQNTVWAQNTPAPTTPAAASTTKPGATRSGDGIKLDFVNAEIAEVARTFGVIMKRNFVVDPRVKGQMNLVTENSIYQASAYDQFLATLRLQGFTVVESAGIYKVVPEAEAKLQGGAVNMASPASAGQSSTNRAGGNQIVTQIFRLNHENPNNLVAVLRPLISPNNTINVSPNNNSLVITDYTDNLQRISRIIAALDVSNATDVEIVPLRHAIAADLVPLLTRLADAGAAAPASAGTADTSFRTAIIAENRANAIIIRAANPARVNLIKTLIDKLDQAPVRSSNGDAGNIYVVYLKNADAVKLATTLRAALSADAGASSAAPAAAARPAAPAAGGASAQGAAPSTGGQIQADPTLNALIISASEPQYRQIRAVIEKLDQRRAQVLIEVLIAEVNSDRAAEFGIQWQTALGKNGNSVIGGLGTNFAGSGNIVDLSLSGVAQAVGNIPKGGLNLAVAKQTNGIYVLGALAKFLESNDEASVVSSPNLLTLDNEEAKIVVGRNIAFVTGQFTNSGKTSGGGSVDPFQTIERKDVGLTLRIKPQINEDGLVKLQVFQENSDVDDATSPNGPSTTKQSVETNVVVSDGNIIVLGGLAKDRFDANRQKVPGLGDVPFFGNLFKSETRKRESRQLMLFLRPVIVRNEASSQALSLDRYEIMRSGQKEIQPAQSRILGINEATVSPPQLQPGQGGTTPTPLGIPANTLQLQPGFDLNKN